MIASWTTPAAGLLPREAWPEVTGRPGPTQGRYGAAGNLELAAEHGRDADAPWFPSRSVILED